MAVHDHDFVTPARPRAAARRAADRVEERELGPSAIAALMLAGFPFGPLLVELLGLLRHHPGVALLLGRAL